MSTLTFVVAFVAAVGACSIIAVASVLSMQPRWWIEHRRRALQQTLADIDEAMRVALISGDRNKAYLQTGPREFFACELARLPARETRLAAMTDTSPAPL